MQRLPRGQATQAEPGADLHSWAPKAFRQRGFQQKQWPSFLQVEHKVAVITGFTRGTEEPLGSRSQWQELPWAGPVLQDV